MFIQQCIDKANIDKSDKILQRTLKFIPAHIKLQNAIITQEDCLSYLKNDDDDNKYIVTIQTNICYHILLRYYVTIKLPC